MNERIMAEAVQIMTGDDDVLIALPHSCGCCATLAVVTPAQAEAIAADLRITATMVRAGWRGATRPGNA